MIMCELPQDMRELPQARYMYQRPTRALRARSALGGGYAEEYEEGEPPEPEPEPEPEVAPEPALIAWLSRKNLQAYRE